MMVFIARTEMPMENSEWPDKVKGILKSELKRRNLTYRDLADLLEKIGVEEKPENINNKISRGTFSAIFFIQALTAIGATEVRLD